MWIFAKPDKYYCGESHDRSVIQFSTVEFFSRGTPFQRDRAHNVPRMCFALNAREVALLKAKAKAVYNIKRIHLETRRPEF